MRSQGDGKGIQLERPAEAVSLERALEYIDVRRIRRSHAEESAPAQKDPRRKPAQTLRKIARAEIRAGVIKAE